MAPCLCAPTSHRGSFRCHLHRSTDQSIEQDASTTNRCMCAPTSHPGSFRCRRHRTIERSWGGRPLKYPAQTKSSQTTEPGLIKPGDNVSAKKIPFARSNRLTSESKIRCTELNKAVVAAGQSVSEMTAALDKLGTAPAEIVIKMSKVMVPPIQGNATIRATPADQENAALTDAPINKTPKEVSTRPQQNAARRSCATSKEQRLRARSDGLDNFL